MPEHLCEYGKSIYYKLQITSELSGSFGPLHVVPLNNKDNMGLFPISPSTFLVPHLLLKFSRSCLNLVSKFVFSAEFSFFFTVSSYVLARLPSTHFPICIFVPHMCTTPIFNCDTIYKTKKSSSISTKN